MELSVEGQQAVPIAWPMKNVKQVKKFVAYGAHAEHRQTVVVIEEERPEHQQSREPEQKM